jgi:hypothetical protein
MNNYNDPKGHAGSLKTPLGLIPPTAMEQVAWAHKLGADKYGPWNWRKTGVCASTYVNAIMRHLNAWRDGEDLDPESGFSHLAHIACSCNILMDAAKVGKLQDDRSKLPTNGEKKQYSLEVGELEYLLQEWDELVEAARKDFEEFGLEVADCDLKEEACDSNSEPQDMGECTCGRRYIYHWLYGWLCEDCELKYKDPYETN